MPNGQLQGPVPATSLRPLQGWSVPEIPESVLHYATPTQINRYLTDPRVQASPGGRPIPKKAEDVALWRKGLRLLGLPSSLITLGAEGVLQTSGRPSLKDVLTLKKDVSFRDILEDKGAAEDAAVWGGLGLDLALGLATGGIGLFNLTKAGKAAKFVADKKLLYQAVSKTREALKGLEDLPYAKPFIESLDAFDLSKLTPYQKDVIARIGSNQTLQYGETLFDQAAKAQRALLTFNVPFINKLGEIATPKFVNMMAFALPTGIRKFLTGTAKKALVSTEPGRMMLDAGASMWAKAQSTSLARNIDKVFQRVLKAQQERAMAQVMGEFAADVKMVDMDTWEQVASAFEKRHLADLAASKMDTADLLKAGLKSDVAGNPHVQKVLRGMRDTMKNTIDFERLLKLPIEKLDDDLNYLIHYITPEGLKALGKAKAFAGSGRVWGEKHASMLRRMLRGRTIEELNKAAQEGTLEVIPGVKLKGRFFDVNPLTLMSARMARMNRAVTGALYMRTMAEQFGKAIAPGLKGADKAKALAGLKAEGYELQSASKFLDDYRFKDPVIKNEIDRHFAKAGQVDSMNNFWHFHDAVMSTWRGFQLLHPATWTRNWTNNIWVSWMSETRPDRILMGRLALSPRLAKSMGRDYDEILKAPLQLASGQTSTLGALMNEATNFRVLPPNSAYADMLTYDPKTAMRMLNEGRGGILKNIVNPRANENTLLKLGFDFNKHVVENPFRFGHYIDRRIKGDNPWEAAMSVKKYFFDYDEMTDFERVWLRRLIPFYSWMRFNIPLQFEMLMSKPSAMGALYIPEKSKAIPHVLGLDDREAETKLLSEWQREGAPLFLGRDPKDPDKVRYLMLDGWIGSADLVRLFDPGNYFVQNLTPILKEPWQQYTGMDFFFRRPFVTLPGMKGLSLERDDFLGLSWPRRLVHVLRNVRAFNEIDRAFEILSTPTKGTLTKPQRLALRLVSGGSIPLTGGVPGISEEKGRIELAFRLRDIVTSSRKAYIRAIRRNRPEEAVAIMTQAMKDIQRGYR
jgi:hypothetical protein